MVVVALEAGGDQGLGWAAGELAQACPAEVVELAAEVAQACPAEPGGAVPEAGVSGKVAEDPVVAGNCQEPAAVEVCQELVVEGACPELAEVAEQAVEGKQANRANG